VGNYLATGRAPDVSDYIYRVKLRKNLPGQLFVLPAGANDHFYRERLQAINWVELYEKHDGYLLFEEVKLQIHKQLNVDYVLIDSRTGYTDTASICTRQLPHAVVLLFFPNDQHLAGLESVVPIIRRPIDQDESSPPHLHFVMSNVPRLDDEARIIRDRLRTFRQALDFTHLDAILWHYPTLELADQRIFTLERPRTLLAAQYRKLTDAITRPNVADPLYILLRIQEQQKSVRTSVLRSIRLNALKFRFLSDFNDLLHCLIKGLMDVAPTKVIADACTVSYMERLRAELAIQYNFPLGESEERDETIAPNEATFLLCSTFANIFVELVRLAAQYKPALLLDIAHHPRMIDVIPSIPLGVLLEDDVGVKALAVIGHELHRIQQDNDPVQQHTFATILPTSFSNIVLGLIGAGEFQLAKALLEKRVRCLEPHIADVFNYAMAEWGDTGTIPVSHFKQVQSLHESAADNSNQLADANYWQCLALTVFVLGQKEQALQWLHVAERMAQGRDNQNDSDRGLFSCWRYRLVSPRDFLSDCQEMRLFFEGQPNNPRVFRSRIATDSCVSASPSCQAK
jgi:hypothetical protein